jgi:hypothetical protein
VRNALLLALLLQEFDDCGQDEVAVWAVYKRFEDGLDGASRFTVVVEGVCFEECLQQSLQIGRNERYTWIAISAGPIMSSLHTRTVVCHLVLEPPQTLNSQFRRACHETTPQYIAVDGLRFNLPIHSHLISAT